MSDLIIIDLMVAMIIGWAACVVIDYYIPNQDRCPLCEEEGGRHIPHCGGS
jgi:hypothetical protein